MDKRIITLRKNEVEQEIVRLQTSMDKLQLELKDLATTERVIEELTGAKRDSFSQTDKPKPKKISGKKPSGLPTTKKMIIESLEHAASIGRRGFAPREIRDYILGKYHFNIKAQANTVAWRLWHDKLLEKDEESGIYMMPKKIEPVDDLLSTAPSTGSYSNSPAKGREAVPGGGT